MQGGIVFSLFFFYITEKERNCCMLADNNVSVRESRLKAVGQVCSLSGSLTLSARTEEYMCTNTPITNM